MNFKNVKILVVDDDRDILKVISANLKLDGFNVLLAENGIEAYNLLKNSHPDLIILDLNLPDIDGVKLCPKLRDENFNIPIIMLTARDTVSDKVLGLECGADDYVVKPFNFLELSARIKSCLRRYLLNKNKVESYKNITINYDKREVLIEGKSINLTKTEYELFIYLFNNRGKVCSRRDIKNNLWKEKEIYDWSRTIDVHINHLRKKLSNKVIIKTVPGVGYILE